MLPLQGNKVTAMNHLELDTITKYKYNKRIRIQLKYTNTIKEYKYNKKLPIKQAVLALHGNKVTAMNHLDSQLGREVVEEEFRFHELLERPVLFSVILVLVFCFFPLVILVVIFCFSQGASAIPRHSGHDGAPPVLRPGSRHLLHCSNI